MDRTLIQIAVPLLILSWSCASVNHKRTPRNSLPGPRVIEDGDPPKDDGDKDVTILDRRPDPAPLPMPTPSVTVDPRVKKIEDLKFTAVPSGFAGFNRLPTAAFADVRIYGANTLVAATERNGIAISTDNGITWTTRTTSSGLPDNRILAMDMQGAGIYALTSKGLAYSSNFGASWTLLNKEFYYQGARLIVQGQKIFISEAFDYSLSMDGGVTWKHARIPNEIGSVTDIVHTNSRIYAPHYTAISVSDDQGKTWTDLMHPKVGDSIYRLKKLAVDGTMLYGISDSRIWKSADKGATWEFIASSTSVLYDLRVSGETIVARRGKDLFGRFSAVDSFQALTVSSTDQTLGTFNAFNMGSAVWTVAASNGFAISKDQGKTWQRNLPKPVYDPAGGISAMCAQGEVIYVLQPGRLVLSRNRGFDWELVRAFSSSAFDMSCSEGQFFVATSSGIESSTDGGANWNVTGSAVTGGEVRRVKIDNKRIWAVGTKILWSDDGGLNWASLPMPPPFKYGADCFYQKGELWLVGGSAGLSRSTNAGQTWTTVFEDLSGPQRVNDILEYKGNLYLSTVFKIQRSVDQGLTWTDFMSPGGSYWGPVSHVQFVNNLVISSQDGGLVISTDFGKTGLTKTPSSGLASTLVQGYYILNNRIYVFAEGGLSVSDPTDLFGP